MAACRDVFVSLRTEMVRRHTGPPEGYGGLLHVLGMALPTHVCFYSDAVHLVHRPLLLPRRTHGLQWLHEEGSIKPPQCHRYHQLLRHGKVIPSGSDAITKPTPRPMHEGAQRCAY